MSFQFQGDGFRLPLSSLGDRVTQVGSSHHFTGRLVLGNGPGRVVGTESDGELNCAFLLISRRETADLIEQVAFEWHYADGEVRTHFIDFVVEQHGGRRIGYAAWPEDRVSAEGRECEDLTKRFQDGLGAVACG